MCHGNQTEAVAKVVELGRFWFNTNYHSAIKMTPFQALYGRHPPAVVRGDVEKTTLEEVSRVIEERNLLLQELKQQLTQAQNHMKQSADQQRMEVEYKVGDIVFL